jgi:hypothetical protein
MDVETAVTMDSVNESRLLATIAAGALGGGVTSLSSTVRAAAEGPGPGDDDDEADEDGDVGNIDPDDDEGYDDDDEDDDEEPLQVRHRT